MHRTRRARAARGRLAVTAVVAITAAGASVAAAAPERVQRSAPPHRLHLPSPPLSHVLTVDEQEWSVRPSETAVAAGPVRITVYNRGMDAHDLTVQGPDELHGRIRGVVTLASGASAVMTVHLTPGTYVLYCSMFIGTPQSHYARGMHATITAR